MYVDGTNIKDWNILKYRAHVGVVGQEPVLFDLTIEENIKYGCVKDDGSVPTRQEVEEAAQLANIHDFIMSLPNQYETKVGEMGSLLSGGQKQRVAIGMILYIRLWSLPFCSARNYSQTCLADLG